MSGLFGMLQERGFVKDASDTEGLSERLGNPLTAYCGYDPTADSLHVGNLLSVMLLAHLQRRDHNVIVIVGGGTGLIGDPSGKSTQRRLLDREQIRRNLESLRVQFDRFLDPSDGKLWVLDNADWLGGLGYLDFLRDVGRHFTVNQLLSHETYRERVGMGGSLSFIEFNYALLQAYDFLHLYREYGCELQVGGADQWFNILSGIGLIRRTTGGKAYGVVSPLLTTGSGRKMGKTEAGAVWLDPAKTSPYDYYQFWVNTEDADVERFLKLFTFLPVDEIRRLCEHDGAELRSAKEFLAYEATSLCHGESAAAEARETAHRLFYGGGAQARETPTLMLDASLLTEGLSVGRLFVLAGLCASGSEAKRLIEQRGASIDGHMLTRADEAVPPHTLSGDALLLRAGKKRYRQVRFTGARAGPA